MIIYEAIAPSNIAFLKYWGKKDAQSQWPANDSLSLTLSKLSSRTRACLDPEARDHRFSLAGEDLPRQNNVARKAFQHLDFLAEKYAFAGKLRVESENSFPTGCGIASSASGLAALTLAAIAAWTSADSLEALDERGFSREVLAHLARLGSGSACRSLWGGVVKWEAGESADSQRVYPVFSQQHWRLSDTVVLFSEVQKKRGSTEAHQDAWTSPLFAPRLAELPIRVQHMQEAIAAKDWQRLGPLLEQEALEMHAVMMSAQPPTAYFQEETADFLAWLRRLRNQHGLPAYFTMDAGPNVHIICEQKHQPQLVASIEQAYPHLKLLLDEVGAGPQLRAFAAP